MLTARAPTRSTSTASAALGWAAVFICVLYAAFAVIMAIAAVLDWLDSGGHGTGRSAPPLFVLHALSGAVALVAGSLQLRLATRLLGGRALHRRIGQTYLWAVWITSLSSLGVAAFFDVSVAAKACLDLQCGPGRQVGERHGSELWVPSSGSAGLPSPSGKRPGWTWNSVGRMLPRFHAGGC